MNVAAGRFPSAEKQAEQPLHAHVADPLRCPGAIAGVKIGDVDMSQLGVGTLIGCIFVLLVALVIIAMVRRAKTAGTSKFWDVLFLILGILSTNIFYFLGGLFGLIARK